MVPLWRLLDKELKVMEGLSFSSFSFEVMKCVEGVLNLGLNWTNL
jgi:hypothetical protein